MFFVWLGYVAAALLLITGAGMVITGFLFAVENNQSDLQQYFPGRSTGQVIDQGLRLLMIAIPLGILCHIAILLERLTAPRG